MEASRMRRGERRSWRVASVGLLGLLAGTATVAAGGVERTLPAAYTPGAGFGVVLTVEPSETTAVYAVEETVPAGWAVTSVSHGGTFDDAAGRVKWGPFTESPLLSRSLSYVATAPSGSVGPGIFAGRAQFDGVMVEVSGPSSLGRFPGAMVRALPAYYVAGGELEVVLTVEPAADGTVYAVEERVPAGWMVMDAGDGGEWDNVTGRIKWGPFTDLEPGERTFSYRVEVPVEATGTVHFAGRAVFDAVVVEAAGPSALDPQPSVIRATMPATFEPGVPLAIEAEVVPAPTVRAWSLEWQVPEGWTVAGIPESGVWDAASGRLKWGPFVGESSLARILGATVTPPEDADGVFGLEGMGWFDAVAVGFGVETRRHREHEDHSLRRVLPSAYWAGEAVRVSLEVTPRDGSGVIAVEETPPAGWSVVPGSVTGGGFHDAALGRVKWGPFLAPDTGSRVLEYEVLPPSGARGEAPFSGRGEFGGTTVPTGGDATILGPAGYLVRTLPPRYTAGVEWVARIEVRPAPDIEVYAVEESVPAGWEFLEATEGGAYDPVAGRIKWGPFPDATLRTLTYRMQPVAGPETAQEFVGQAAFESELVATTGDSVALRNVPPLAIPDSAGRVAGELFKISAIKLTLNDSDPDGDLPTVTSVDALSENGAEVVLDWPWVYYLPLPGDDRPDRFRYTIDDGFGATASAWVNLTVQSPVATLQNIVSIESLPDGSRRIVFMGVPGYTYRIEGSPNLVTWEPLGSREAGANGRFEYVDEDAPDHPTRYYRSVWP